MRFAAALVLSALPFAAFAAGSDPTPPATTETTTVCAKGEVWDEKTKACIKSDDARLDNDTRFGAVRELAYADRPEEALAVLASMTEGKTDRVLTYLGFANRKAGRLELGMQYYTAALTQNPDNILARSYYGQMLVEMNEVAMAQEQLDAIRNRGGAGTWAEITLASAIVTGATTNY